MKSSIKHIGFCLAVALIFASQVLAQPQSISNGCPIGPSHTEPTEPTTYYVAERDGDDNHNGLSLPQAFKTIEKANSVVQPGDTVVIRYGHYFQTGSGPHFGQVNVIRPDKGGIANYPITYTNYLDEKPTLYGARKITSTWTQVGSSDVWTTTVNPNVTQLYFGNDLYDDDKNTIRGHMEAFHEARWPNLLPDQEYTSMPRAEAGPGTHQYRVVIDNSDLPSLPPVNLDGARVHIVPGKVKTSDPNKFLGFIGFNRQVINDQDGSAGRQFNFWPPAWPQAGATGEKDVYYPKQGNHYWLYGHPALLDQQKEWFYDENTSELTVHFPPGIDPNDDKIVIAYQSTTKLIDTDPYVTSAMEHIQVLGLRFFSGGWFLDESSNNILVEDCKFRHVQHLNPRIIDEDEPYLTPVWTGVLNQGNDNVFRSCSFQYSTTCMFYDGKEANNTFVGNCFMEEGDYLGLRQGMIRAEGSQDARFQSNTLKHSGGTMIQVSTAERTRINNNEMREAGKLVTDLGFVYAYATDGSGEVDGEFTLISHNNFQGNDHLSQGNGVYLDAGLDGGCSNFLIQNNIIDSITRTAIRINSPSTENLIRKNYIGSHCPYCIDSLDAAGTGLDFANSEFKNNVVLAIQRYGPNFIYESDFTGGGLFIGADASSFDEIEYGSTITSFQW